MHKNLFYKIFPKSLSSELNISELVTHKQLNINYSPPISRQYVLLTIFWLFNSIIYFGNITKNQFPSNTIGKQIYNNNLHKKNQKKYKRKQCHFEIN